MVINLVYTTETKALDLKPTIVNIICFFFLLLILYKPGVHNPFICERVNDGKVTVSCYSSHVQNGCTAAKKYENKPVKAIFFYGYKLSGFKSLIFIKTW